MDWGILQGLGQGLQQIGAAKMEQSAEQKRAELADKLQQDREARDALKYDPKQDKPVQEGANWFIQRYSASGKPLDKVPLAENQRQELVNAQERDKITVESLRGKAEQEASMADYLKNLTPEKRALYFDRQAGLAASADSVEATARAAAQDARAERVAQIRAAGDVGGSSTAKGSVGGGGDSYSDMAADFKEEDPSTFLDVGKIAGTTSDSATKAVVAALIQELTAQFPDRKLSGQDVIAAARAYRKRWASKNSQDSDDEVVVPNRID